jgi:hypothetical protein
MEFTPRRFVLFETYDSDGPVELCFENFRCFLENNSDVQGIKRKLQELRKKTDFRLFATDQLVRDFSPYLKDDSAHAKLQRLRELYRPLFAADLRCFK